MGLDPGVAQLVRLLDQACREAGFFYLKGHGIPKSLIKDVRALSHKFFELSYEEKLNIKMTSAAGYSEAHTDYGLLTLVNQDDSITALQVRNLSGEWISAVPVPGTFVCNIGDMLKIWSNGLYNSTSQRVINNSPVYRVCIAYFNEPNSDVVVEPLDFWLRKPVGARSLGELSTESI